MEYTTALSALPMALALKARYGTDYKPRLVVFAFGHMFDQAYLLDAGVDWICIKNLGTVYTIPVAQCMVAEAPESSGLSPASF